MTKQEALVTNNFYHARANNADGTPLRARRNGRTQVWKTRPEAFRVPIKIGLYDYSYINEASTDWLPGIYLGKRSHD